MILSIIVIFITVRMFISIKLVNKSIKGNKFDIQNGLRAISDENARFINEVIQKDTNNALSNELKLWRTRTSQELNKKPYQIFPNKVIEGIVFSKPKNKDQLSIINGVGPNILSDYGENILEIVKKYVREGEDDKSALLENLSSKLVNTSKHKRDFMDHMYIYIYSILAKISFYIKAI